MERVKNLDPKKIRSHLKDSHLYAILLCLGVLIFDHLLIQTAPLVASISPILGIILAWLWLLLPGLIVSLILIERISWIERIPIAFILAIGLTTPATIVSILLRLSLEQYLWLIRGTLILSVILLYLFRMRHQDSKQETSSIYPVISRERFTVSSIGLLIFVIATAVCLAYLSSIWLPDGDDISGLPIFSEVLRLERITSAEPFHGTGTPSTPRNELIAWTYLGILINKITGVPPVEYFMYTRPVLIGLAFLSLYFLLHQLFKNRRQALFLLSLWSVYLLATTREEGMGNNLVTRLIQDKFLGWFVLVPVLLVFLLWFLEDRERRYLFCLGIGALGATFVHPITLTHLQCLGERLQLYI